MLVVPDDEQSEGANMEKQLLDYWEDGVLREEAIVVLCGMPANPDDWSELGSPGISGGIATVLQVLGKIQQSYSVDPNRTYIAGYGRGVATAGIIASRYPHVFAGLIGRSGDLTRFRRPTSGTSTASAWRGRRRVRVCDGGRRARLRNGAGGAMMNTAAVWQWAKATKRVAHPEHVVFAPTDDYGTEAYWLKVSGYDVEKAPRIEARLDRENGVIEVTGGGLLRRHGLAHDHMLDLGNPVRVVINGVEHESQVQRSLAFLLNKAFVSGDSGRLFVGERTLPFTSSTQAE